MCTGRPFNLPRVATLVRRLDDGKDNLESLFASILTLSQAPQRPRSRHGGGPGLACKRKEGAKDNTSSHVSLEPFSHSESTSLDAIFIHHAARLTKNWPWKAPPPFVREGRSSRGRQCHRRVLRSAGTHFFAPSTRSTRGRSGRGVLCLMTDESDVDRTRFCTAMNVLGCRAMSFGETFTPSLRTHSFSFTTSTTLDAQRPSSFWSAGSTESVLG